MVQDEFAASEDALQDFIADLQVRYTTLEQIVVNLDRSMAQLRSDNSRIREDERRSEERTATRLADLERSLDEKNRSLQGQMLESNRRLGESIVKALDDVAQLRESIDSQGRLLRQLQVQPNTDNAVRGLAETLEKLVGPQREPTVKIPKGY